MTARAAAFLDRDGTLIEDAHYLADPAGVRLLPGIVAPLHQLRARGVATVVVTNQSGIAQGVVTEAQYEATRARLDALLAAEGVQLEASYHCPHHPSVSGPCPCRKPGLGMYERAARDLGLDVTRSLYVGDRRRDVEPGLALGGTGILVPSTVTPADDLAYARAHAVVCATLAEAVARWLARLDG